MDNERRKHDETRNAKSLSLLNTEQALTLHRIESFGWTLEFVRQPLFEQSVPVVIGADGKTIGIIEQDGNLNVNTDVDVRVDGGTS